MSTTPTSTVNLSSISSTSSSSTGTTTEGVVSNFALELLSWLLGLIDNVAYLLRYVNGPKAPKFFKRGWGIPTIQNSFDVQDKLLNELLKDDYTHVTLNRDDIQWNDAKISNGISLRQGQFVSPLAHVLPSESRHCKFWLVEPTTKPTTSSSSSSSPVYIIMLPATGEQGKRERLSMAKQLATEYGWNSILVTAPYYASRKPVKQQKFFLTTVGDPCIQSMGIVQETTSIIRYLMRSNDDNPSDSILPPSSSTKVLVTGFSWGSSMSSISSTMALLAGVDGRRLGCVNYVGCSSPEVFADGVLVNGIDWNALLTSNKNKDASKDDYMTIGGVDCSSLETPQQAQQAMKEVLSKVQLSIIVDALDQKNKKKNMKNQLAAVNMQCMINDGFLRRPYSENYIEHMKRLTSETNFSLQWLPGGHVVGAAIRPFVQKRAIINTVHQMIKSE